MWFICSWLRIRTLYMYVCKCPSTYSQPVVSVSRGICGEATTFQCLSLVASLSVYDFLPHFVSVYVTLSKCPDFHICIYIFIYVCVYPSLQKLAHHLISHATMADAYQCAGNVTRNQIVMMAQMKPSDVVSSL